MGQAGSQPAAAPRRPAPHEPLRRAPKVLPSLSASPRLRSTDNGAILQSGGTISGRRPHPAHPAPSSNESDRTDYQHQGVFRSRSAGAGAGAELRARERDPLHRSHTNLDLRSDSSSLNKRFGSEPDLRNDEEQPKSKCNNKHFRKKYRAPPPPADEVRDESSPDSSNGNARTEPPKKLRLFKTRTETKKMIGQSSEPNYPERGAHLMEYKSLDYSVGNNDAFERRYRSPYKMKEQNFKYPDSKSMLQSNFSLKREENVLQDSRKPDNRNSRISKIGGCKAKMSKSNESNDTCKTPLFNRDFRNSERFKRENSDIAIMRREKSFDATLIANEREADMAKNLHANRMKAISEQLKDSKLSPLTQNDKPFRKSLPSLLTKTNEEKDEFQTELKKATSRFRNELSNKKLVSENKPSQNDSKNANNHIKANPTKNVPLNKVKESSLKTNNLSTTKQQSSIPKLIGHSKKLERLNEPNLKKQQISNNKINCAIEQNNAINNQDNRNFADRGQASGKESTPEHSPTRYKEGQSAQENLQIAPSKQFYFGMIESKQTNLKENLKDFPGLGSPIIEEISNFHLIEKKLLSYQDDDAEFNKFNEELDKQNQNTKTKNISSESALSSDGSEGEGSGSEDSLGIALRLRPTIPKKQPSVPRFSPAAAWRQLAHFDAHLTAETQPLAVETKVCGEPAAESSPRSEQSGDKSGDSGISGDHAHSDPRLDSPARQHLNLVNGIDADHAAGGNETWTPQQDLGDSSSDGAGALGVETAVQMRPDGLVTYSARGQPFSLSLPREPQEKGKPLQQGFNSLQKLKKSVSGALGAALGARRFDLEHEPMLPEAEQNWFLTKSAPTSLSNPLLLQHRTKGSNEKDIKEENSPPPFEKDDAEVWRRSEDSGAGAGASYLSWGGHVMYLPPAPRAPEQPLSLIGPFEKPIRSKSSGELEVAARAARARAGAHGLAGEMRERDRSASPGVRRALPARVEPYNTRSSSSGGKARAKSKRFTFQSTVRQVERKRLAEKLSREAELKEQQRRTELEAMRRVEEEFQRKRAREKASIRQQLRLVSGAAGSPRAHRDEPDGSASRAGSGCGERPCARAPHSRASSEISARSKSTTPVRSVELTEWRNGGPRQYLDWGAPAGVAASHAHPAACARMPKAAPCTAVPANNGECEAFTGSPRSDNYRLEFARGVPRSPRTPRAPRLLPAPRSPSTSGSELSLRQPIRISEPDAKEQEEPAIVPTLRPARPARTACATLAA